MAIEARPTSSETERKYTTYQSVSTDLSGTRMPTPKDTAIRALTL
jgi:hypothetical protein